MVTLDQRNGSAIVVAQPVAIETLAERTGYERDKIDLVKRTVAKGTTDDELELFLAFCQESKLDPLSRQVYAIKRFDSKLQREVMSIQVGIDGFRSIAQSSGEYDGQEGPQWCGPDGEWKDVWTARELPVACRVGIYRKGQTRPVWGLITYAEFCQRGKDGQPIGMWRTMPIHMMGVRAESHGLRKALPRSLGRVELAEAPVPQSIIEEAEHPHLPPPGQMPGGYAMGRARIEELWYSDDEDDNNDGAPAPAEVIDHMTGEILAAEPETAAGDGTQPQQLHETGSPSESLLISDDDGPNPAELQAIADECIKRYAAAATPGRFAAAHKHALDMVANYRLSVSQRQSIEAAHRESARRDGVRVKG